jgi:bifunctional non-homologous end joining protein LigD
MPVELANWAVEPKWDGWRCLARLEDGAVQLTSRWRRDLTPLFPQFAALPHSLATKRLLLDGEVVALRRDGGQDFHALTRRRVRDDVRLAFMCFDVLHVDGFDLTAESYSTRRAELERLQIKHDHWLTTPSARGGEIPALYAFTLTHGWEGVVAKRIDSPYRPVVRDGAWLKAKHPHARDLQVDRLGWTRRERVAEPLRGARLRTAQAG